MLAALEQGRSEEYETALREQGVPFRITEDERDPLHICADCVVRGGKVEPRVAGFEAPLSGTDLDARIEAAVSAALKKAGLASARRNGRNGRNAR